MGEEYQVTEVERSRFTTDEEIQIRIMKRGKRYLYNRREKMLKLCEELLAVEEDRMCGSKSYSVDEVAAMMRNAIKEAAGHGTPE